MVSNPSCAGVIIGEQGVGPGGCSRPFAAPAYGTFETMRRKLNTDTLQAMPWEISNHQKGLIWLDENGKRTQSETWAALYRNPHRIPFGVEDRLMGPLLFTGPCTQAGQVELLPVDAAAELAESINRGSPCRVAGFWFSIIAPVLIGN